MARSPRSGLPRRALLLLGAAGAAVLTMPDRGRAADSLRVGMIPDAGATQVSVDQKKPLQEYLAAKLGRDVALIIPTNYNATVEALGNGSLDFAYLGGLTYVKANAQYGALPLVQRSSDRSFHSLFITQSGSTLRGLPDLRGKTFAFGDINSTSGHLMPYYALAQAGLNPEKDLTYRYTGNHPATAKAVEAGIVDAGAIDESVYRALLSGGELDSSKVRVFFTTPPFVDYVWVARKESSRSDRDRFTKAFLSLRQPKDAAVLDILRGTSFVTATDGEYATLRMVAAKLKLL